QGIDIAAQQSRDIDLHGFTAQVIAIHNVAVDWSVLVLGEHDGDFGTNARAGGTLGLAVVLIANFDSTRGRNAIHIEQAEAQTLHAIGAAREIDDREPGLPGSRTLEPQLIAKLIGAFGGLGRVRSIEWLK